MAYTMPADAGQLGTTDLLSTIDCRVKAAYLENNRIQFCFNASMNNETGLYYATLELANPLAFSSASGIPIIDDTLIMAMPSMAYAGQQGLTGINTSYVGFNYTSPWHYPGNGAVYIDETGDVSEPVILKTGEAVSSGIGIWGPYTGMQERYDDPGTAWMIAGFNGIQGNQDAFISELSPPQATNRGTDVEPLAVNLYPVPTSDHLTLNIAEAKKGIYQVRLVDLLGRSLQESEHDHLTHSDLSLNLDVSRFTPGIYFLEIQSESGKFSRAWVKE